MPPRATFSLRVPDSKPVEVQLIELADGRIVARTADELAPPTPPAAAPRA
jgi:hypothetical protein